MRLSWLALKVPESMVKQAPTQRSASTPGHPDVMSLPQDTIVLGSSETGVSVGGKASPCWPPGDWQCGLHLVPIVFSCNTCRLLK